MEGTTGGLARRSRRRTWALPALRTEPRPIPHVRAARTALRTAHLAAVGALYGGHVYGVEPQRLVPALLATLATGGAFVALEMVRLPVWLFQIRGAATMLKLLLVIAVPVFWEQRVILLTLALVIGAVSAHMPARWRYHSLRHGHVVGPVERG